MNPSEVTNILRQFNEWQRGHNTVLRPSSNELGEAIDAAVEMIDRLEAAERSDAESIAMYRKARDERDELRAENETLAANLRGKHRITGATYTHLIAERDALRAKIAEMEQQEPVAWARKLAMDLPSFGCVTDLKYRPSNMPESAYMPPYALPGAQIVPDVDALAQLIREIDGKHQLGAGALAERIVEWLAAAPEAKP